MTIGIITVKEYIYVCSSSVDACFTVVQQLSEHKGNAKKKEGKIVPVLN
jgi:hypothetical protein